MVPLKPAWAKIDMPEAPGALGAVAGDEAEHDQRRQLHQLEVGEGEQDRRRHQGQPVAPAGLDRAQHEAAEEELLDDRAPRPPRARTSRTTPQPSARSVSFSAGSLTVDVSTNGSSR